MPTTFTSPRASDPLPRVYRALGLHAAAAALLAGLLGCADRGMGGDELGEPSADTDPSAVPDDDPEAMGDAGQTSTSGTAPVADESGGEGPELDLPPDPPGPSDPPDPSDPCAPHLEADQDPAQVCGLLHVDFEAGSEALGFGAACRLTAAAPCIAEQPGVLYLEAHAAADEGPDEEGAILLSQQRGETVKAFLEDEGVAPGIMQVVAKGNLRAQQPAIDEDRRVRLLW